VLRFLRRGQRWLTAVIVAGVGVVFAMFLGLGGPLQGPSAGAVIQVGPHRFGLGEFERVRSQREEQLREAVGDAFDEKAFRGPLDDFAASVLVERAILAMEAERLGLAVSNQEVERLVRSSGSFRDADGRFDPEQFRGFVEYEFGTERSFLASQRLVLLANKMLQVLHDLPRVSDAEVRQALRMRLEEIRLAFVAFDPDEEAAEAEVADERIAAFLAERDAEARALYESRADVYDVPEQVRARHILLRVPAQAGPEAVSEVEARARAILERVRGGEDFAAVASEASEDPGSAKAGGDLGFFARGRMVKAFEDAAFALEPGATSDLVRSDFGFHVIRVEERRAAENRPYEAVREELAREILAAEVAREGAMARAEGLAAAIRDGASLEAAARDAELTLERTGSLRRRPDGFVPGLGAAQELMAAAFTMQPGQSSPQIFEVDGKLALVQVLERQAPSELDVERQLAAEREALLQAKREAQVAAWVNARRAELREAGELHVDLAALGR
jgi:peptidyl-prolyl cis-trans isomerase D